MENEEETNNVQIPKGKRRQRQPESWNCNVRKVSKLKGEEYKTTKGNIVPKKTIVSPICR